MAGEEEEGQYRWSLSFRYRLPPDWSLPLFSPSPERQAACASVMLEAMLAALAGYPEVSYSRRKSFYNQSRYFDADFGYRPVMWAVDALASEGLIEHHKAKPCASGGHRSTLRTMPALQALLPANAWTRVKRKAGETIRLKDAGKQLQDYRETRATRALRREMAEVNEATQALRIGLDGAHDHGGVLRLVLPATERDIALPLALSEMFRVFNNSSWGQGGRLYDGGRAQNLPKEARALLTFDGEPTCEEDFPQLHPTLLYAKLGAALDGDAYDVPGFSRALVKVAFNVLLNAANYQAAKGRLDHDNPGIDVPALIAAVKARHPVLTRAKLFHSGIGLRLQRIDSDLALAVLASLRRQGVAAYPIHDSFIVSERHQSLLQEAMADALAKSLQQLGAG